MSNNELGTNLKGASGDQPWLNLHADDAIGLEAQLRDYLGAFAPQEAVGVGVLIGLANEKYRRELAQATAIVATPQNVQAAAPPTPPPVSVQQPQPAAPAQPAGWQAPEVPQYQAPAAAAPSAPTAPPGAVLPAGVTIWDGKNPKPGKENYDAVLVQYPFIPDAVKRNALREELKTWWLWDDKTTNPWTAALTKNGVTKEIVEAIFLRHADAFAR